MIGDASVGKTSLLNRLIEHRFNELEMSTIGANYQVYTDEVDGVTMGLQIWDTAGQEKFRALGPIYFRKARGAVIVFDVTNEKSFEALEEWISMFLDVAGTDTKLVLIGNKCDVKEGRIAIDEAKDWAEKRGLQLFQTSARTGDGVAEPFRYLAKELIVQTHIPSAREVNTGDGGCFC
jgi:small GTP-binding protein